MEPLELKTLQSIMQEFFNAFEAFGQSLLSADPNSVNRKRLAATRSRLVNFILAQKLHVTAEDLFAAICASFLAGVGRGIDLTRTNPSSAKLKSMAAKIEKVLFEI